MKNLIVLIQWFVLTGAMLSMTAVQAGESPAGVYRQHVNKPISEVYDKLYQSLEEAQFFVVFEPNIGANLARSSEKWGNDYNKNKLSALRSMVFCHAWYANKVSNLDPDMLGFCPLHLSLVERDGGTTVLFNRPGFSAQNSPAGEVLRQVEAEVIAAIKSGLHSGKK